MKLEDQDHVSNHHQTELGRNGYAWRFIVFASLVILILSLVYYFDLQNYLTPNFIKEKVHSFGIFAPLIFILLYVFLTILFFPGSILSLTGGLLFGKWLGLFCILIGASLGSFLAFIFSRYLGRDFIAHKLEKRFVSFLKASQKLEKHGFLFVFIIRLVPFFPYNATNYAFGLSKVKASSYFWGTILGIIPGSFVLVFLGDSFGSFSPLEIGLALLVFLVFSVSIFFLRSYLKKYIENRS